MSQRIPKRDTKNTVELQLQHVPPTVTSDNDPVVNVVSGQHCACKDLSSALIPRYKIYLSSIRTVPIQMYLFQTRFIDNMYAVDKLCYIRK